MNLNLLRQIFNIIKRDSGNIVLPKKIFLSLLCNFSSEACCAYDHSSIFVPFCYHHLLRDVHGLYNTKTLFSCYFLKYFENLFGLKIESLP